MCKVAVLMPSKGRADQLRTRGGNLLWQGLPAGVEWLTLVAAVINSIEEQASIDAAMELVRVMWPHGTSVQVVYREPGSSAADGFNKAYAAVRGQFDWYVLGNDDQIYHKGWLGEALGVAKKENAQVVGLNDGHTNLDEYAPHYMMHYEFIERCLGGQMVPDGYVSWWWDREVCEIARQRGLYAPAWYARVDHRHPDWRTAPWDNTYAEAKPYHDQDKALYMARRAAGYPMEVKV